MFEALKEFGKKIADDAKWSATKAEMDHRDRKSKAETDRIYRSEQREMRKLDSK